jgi:inositol-phosphate phosphatase/L-galactose 1-phosphate phosphatase/histidinol-phosphatase
MAAPCPPDFIALAERLADAAGAAIRPHFREPITVDSKADSSPVTIADREAEKAMRAIINETFPDHGIVGEEFGEERADADYVWVLDPVDGTKAFISGEPTFVTLIALVRNGTPILGVIDQPITNERWTGAAGSPTTLNGKPVKSRPCPHMERAILMTSGPEWFKGDIGAAFGRLHEATAFCRYSADGYAYALVATGFVDITIETGLQTYDYCALVPVVEGAGGVITTWDGSPVILKGMQNIIASGDAAAHRKALDLLAGS